MLYKGFFYNLKNERYTVEIITNHASGATRYIDLGVPPFVTSMEESDDNLFKPARYQSATVKVVTSASTDYKFDVYAKAPNATVVKLYDNNDEVKWCGFATPNLYNIGFNSEHEELEIECIDGLSMLQYYKYSTDQKDIRSFADILLTNILPKCEVYKNLYVERGIERYRESSADPFTPILNDLYISEMNFFDEKSEGQTDKDVAWTCQEVLEQICQYIGVTILADGEDLYMLPLGHGFLHLFDKYEIGSTGHTGVTITAQYHTVQGDDYMATDNNLSMLSTFNKVSVVDKFYTYDSIIPSLYDNLENITSSADTDIQTAEYANMGMYGEIVESKTGNAKTDQNSRMIALVDKIYNDQDDEYTTPNAIFVKYFKSPNFKTYNYSQYNSGNTTYNYTDTKLYKGGLIAKFDVKKLEHDVKRNILIIDNKPVLKMSLDKWLAANDISSISFSNYLLMLNPNAGHIPNEQAEDYPFLETTLENYPRFFGGENNYLVITGSYIWHPWLTDPYPIPTGEDYDLSEGRYYMLEEDCYMLAKLQWGDNYWNGSVWTATDTTFELPYIRIETTNEERRADGTVLQNMNFRNTVSWRVGTDEKGYCIPVPIVMTGVPKLILYKPIDPNYRSYKTAEWKGQWYKHYRVFLKDLDIKAIIGDPTYSDVNDTDTKFEAVLNAGDDSVNEMEEVEFKICTHDGKKPNYSAVCYKDIYGNYQYVDKMTYGFGPFKSEELLIKKFCEQYENPMIKLQLNLDDVFKPYQVFKCDWVGSSKLFVVDVQSKDYYNNTTTITLVERNQEW